MNRPLAPVFILLGALIYAGCDVRSSCGSQYKVASQVDACIEGAKKGAVLAGTISGAGMQGPAAYVWMNQQCEDVSCTQADPGDQEACATACKANASYILQNPNPTPTPSNP
ncbi:MAG TPA: hypothetical protein VL588_06160 [Bdellovibrionota bacterium]|jgi:hypothetical protein|nr:hypothetical protein [Bdellovibrionota bacterium]